MADTNSVVQHHHRWSGGGGGGDGGGGNADIDIATRSSGGGDGFKQAGQSVLRAGPGWAGQGPNNPKEFTGMHIILRSTKLLCTSFVHFLIMDLMSEIHSVHLFNLCVHVLCALIAFCCALVTVT
jgi:hypothetical protein